MLRKLVGAIASKDVPHELAAILASLEESLTVSQAQGPRQTPGIATDIELSLCECQTGLISITTHRAALRSLVARKFAVTLALHESAESSRAFDARRT